MLIDTARMTRCRRRSPPVAATSLTAAAQHAVMEAPSMGLADAATQQLQAHVQQLLYQLADASAAPAAAVQAADAGQQVLPARRLYCSPLNCMLQCHAPPGCNW